MNHDEMKAVCQSASRKLAAYPGQSVPMSMLIPMMAELVDAMVMVLEEMKSLHENMVELRKTGAKVEAPKVEASHQEPKAEPKEAPKPTVSHAAQAKK